MEFADAFQEAMLAALAVATKHDHCNGSLVGYASGAMWRQISDAGALYAPGPHVTDHARRKLGVPIPVASQSRALEDHAFVEDSAYVDPVDARLDVASCLSLLMPDERDVIVRHYGLDGSGGASLPAVAAATGRSRRTTYRIHDRAMAVMREALG